MKGKEVCQKMVALLAAVFFSTHIANASMCDSATLAFMEQTWRDFRAIHPFGFQTVGLRHRGDTCVFVMSEPAEWVRSEELEALFTEQDGCLITARKSFGYDGGLYDAIGCTKLDSMGFKRFESKLFTILYGTDYKPYYTDLDHPAPHVYFSEENLNYSFDESYWSGPFLLEKFVFPFPYSNDNSDFWELIEPLDGPPLNNILCYSKDRGFVVWALSPENIDSGTLFRENARRFALDTDLVLAAFFCHDKIFIVGRERQVPITVLPPLRSETIRLLASLGEQDFSVCLDSDSTVFVQDSVWARPVIMNDRLRDTELGNLLTLADVLLLSWSEESTVRELFIDYPMPTTRFNSGISIQPGDTHHYSYYWVMPEIIPLDCHLGYHLSYYHLRKTGSLKPYLALEGNASTQYDNIASIAYNYFASLNNTDLVRVAQYALIYQAFQIYNEIYRQETAHSDNRSWTDTTQTPFKTNDTWLQTPSAVVLNVPCGNVDFIDYKQVIIPTINVR